MKNKKSRKGESEWEILGLVGGLLAIMLVVWVVKSNFEKKTFNKFTDGEDATLVDAMFSQLRIEANRASK